ncbi:degradation of aromatic compounds protein [Penicillium paradoxum]|uniref:degradation of aromatic compounds protein n=1 Tax=Penicillium paradoxum TaxID=176176 RepID=UPI0025498C58|nr:degradation of aromatic compounds protein [Penicillium paradoxum]KAJ5773451.1 degradation of aromatic compounds protein [Penicillium paradoxum]
MAPSEVLWDRLIRYVSATDDHIRYGEPILQDSDLEKLDQLVEEGQLEVRAFEGNEPITATPTTRIEKVKTLLGPLEVKNTPIIRCIGLNYKSHILESGLSLPVNPTTFIKPSYTVANHGEDIQVPRWAASMLDYEGELAILIGNDVKNASEEDALDYVAGYTAGNDVSARDWQTQPDLAGPMPQWGFSKSLDQFAPLGPVLVARHVLGEANDLSLRTFVNGELRQQGNTSDLCFHVRRIVSFCSRGTTLQKGSIILTGTPGGVGFSMSPPNFLKHGDEVVVDIGRIGKLRNRYVFVDE